MRIETSTVNLATTSEKQLNRSSSDRLSTHSVAPNERLASSGNASGPSGYVSAGGASSDLVYSFESKEKIGALTTSSVAGSAPLSDRQTYVESFATVLLQGKDALSVTQIQQMPFVAAPPATVTGAIELHHSRFQVVESNQKLTFASEGEVVTEDGRNINFTLYLQRESSAQYKASESLVMRMPPRSDPLVINFGAESVALTDTYFKFDINGDGISEELAQLGSGSGFLVFDRNGNGKVDSNTELFGPATGSGFAELATSDTDRNGWIDENDAIFSQLQIWTQDASGGKLTDLKSLGIGAIFIGAHATSYDLIGGSGSLLGSVKAQSLVLMESGEVRTAEEVDLVRKQTFAMDTVATGGALTDQNRGLIAGTGEGLSLKGYVAELLQSRSEHKEVHESEYKTSLEMLIEKWVAQVMQDKLKKQAQSRKYVDL
ncbi:MAG: hypothetical protein H6999_03105 [Hahellaceae bacterium]|nr:hypothetical protein [Hahellaceae bacterium]MCP5168733.1 hypothetical protein [Hahellaceae bacterium]